MFIKLLIISIIFLGISFTGLAIRVLLRSGGRFPETHTGRNKEMRKLGIRCAQKTDIGCTGAGQKGSCESCG